MNLLLMVEETAGHAAESAGADAGHHTPWLVTWINGLIGPATVPNQRAIMETIYGLFGAHWTPPAHGQEIPEHVIFALLAFGICTLGLLLVRGTLSVDKPTNRQQLLEVVVTGVRGMLDDIVGPFGRRYLPIIGAFGLFILVGNLMGMVPGLGAPTGSINVTLGLGLISFAYYVSKGFQQQGLGYLKHFMGGLTSGPLVIVGIVVFFFEVLSNLVRPATLGIRLFLNIFADHQIGGVFESLVPWVVPALLPVPLGLFVALVQTVVFIMLSMIYLSETVPHEEHDHDEHGEHASLAEHQAAIAGH
jgi:F-type H+-transporting ATPase subunit a